MSQPKNYTLSDFVELKKDKYEYCGITFSLRRYLSKDKKVLITTDGCPENDGKPYKEYVRVYIADKDGKGKNIDLVAHYSTEFRNQHNSLTITPEAALPNLNRYMSENPTEFTITINKTHFKNQLQAF